MSIYAVNGKDPVGVWIPSLDTVGNGTTTLTDLFGSNNGTLTNMDAATDWVADTGSGGVRAIVLDGDEYIDVPDGILSLTTWTLTGWGYSTSTAAGNRFLWGSTMPDRSYVVQNGDNFFWQIGLSVPQTVNVGGVANGWHHFGLTFNNGVGKGYFNGVEEGSLSGLSYSNNALGLNIGSFNQSTINSNWIGSVDDLRAFTVALSATDMAWLYNSNTGRGRVASSTISPRRPMTQQSIQGAF